jgi:pimeloyl-ACP methyl ester carboxylesterase
MEKITVIREGEGPEVLLVHGGASPATTWHGLESLAARWTLAFVHRRGYPPSPDGPGPGNDFEVDAADLLPLLDGRPHLVAHSYGGVGAAIATTRRPDDVRSLTLIEPALFLPAGDPEIAEFRRVGEVVLREGLEADPALLRLFLRAAGSPGVDEGPLPEEVKAGVRRAHGSRPPGEADVDLAAIRAAGIPCLVASGAHMPPGERMCDAVADELGAERLVAPGAGHFVPAAPGFADRLEDFLARH